MGVKIMSKFKLFLSLILCMFFVMQVKAENNLTKKQIVNARILLKEYTFMSCLREGFNRKLKKNNQTKEKDTSSDKLFRLDLIHTMKTLALDRYGVYHIEDNMKQVSKKELGVYISIDKFVKDNYLKVRRVNTPFIMQHTDNKKSTVYLTCFDLCNSKKLNDLIEEQDKYISKNTVLDDIIVISSETNRTK